jgi:hypothetical protein
MDFDSFKSVYSDKNVFEKAKEFCDAVDTGTPLVKLSVNQNSVSPQILDLIFCENCRIIIRDPGLHFDIKLPYQRYNHLFNMYVKGMETELNIEVQDILKEENIPLKIYV